MVREYHQLNGHKFEQISERYEQILGTSGVQRALECCNPTSHKESDMTQQLNEKITQCAQNIVALLDLHWILTGKWFRIQCGLQSNHLQRILDSVQFNSIRWIMKFIQIPSPENGSHSNTVTSKHGGAAFQNLVQYKNINFFKANNHFL